ncbi:hypothetical protein [Providencia rustigianii]|uniref:hypothetical protein n=1 Tax=Providencia rustigianii TaxID=158850 RepID=UPI00223FEECA|nr:hypothetical protein [Providencia rustigianii]
MKAKLPHIDADLIRAALALISVNDDSRIVTKVVHINNQCIEATNGHALIRMKHHVEFDQDIAVQFVYSVPEEAEFLDINSHDDGSHTVTYYRQDRDEEFRPFEKSELVLMEERYPDFSNLLDCKHKEGKTPYIASVYLALPYLMFGRGSVDVLPSEDSRSVLFAMDALTSEIYGEPILIAMAMEKDIHKLSQSLRDQIVGIG